MFQIIDATLSENLSDAIIQNEVLGIVNATVSHELRNPLGCLIG